MVLSRVPLIKEHRLDRLRECMRCINAHPFDRDKQRACVLDLYPGKSEKSVFRGMVIPSLRSLGLILGYEGSIRLAANGKLITESEKIDIGLHNRVVRLVVYEIDKEKFGFLDVLLGTKPHTKQELSNTMASGIEGPSEKQRSERISHWTSILEQVELLRVQADGHLIVHRDNHQRLLNEVGKKQYLSKFKSYLFQEYVNIGRRMSDIVDIADLRQSVSQRLLRDDRLILTEKQFDEALRGIPLATDEYIISLGTPMGAEEKLFQRKDRYYRTLSIRTLKEGLR